MKVYAVQTECDGLWETVALFNRKDKAIKFKLATIKSWNDWYQCYASCFIRVKSIKVL